MANELSEIEMSLLSDERLDDYHIWLARYGDGGCHCNIVAPCSSCTHEGNQDNLRVELEELNNKENENMSQKQPAPRVPASDVKATNIEAILKKREEIQSTLRSLNACRQTAIESKNAESTGCTIEVISSRSRDRCKVDHDSLIMALDFTIKDEEKALEPINKKLEAIELMLSCNL